MADNYQAELAAWRERMQENERERLRRWISPGTARQSAPLHQPIVEYDPDCITPAYEDESQEG